MGSERSYVIVRTKAAGVFAGLLESKQGTEATLLEARRIWQWHGAASLSQLAIDGTSNPSQCKFPAPVRRIDLTEVIEVVYASDRARASIAGVPEWRA